MCLCDHLAGILDSHTYMAALLADAESAGASLTVASRVTGGHVASTSGRGAVPVSMAANTVGVIALTRRLMFAHAPDRMSLHMQAAKA